MKKIVLLLGFTISFIAVAQNFQSNLPSENFFSPYSLHHISFTILPSMNYQLNSHGALFNSKNYVDANVNEFVTTMLKNGTNRNYLSFNIQTNYLDFRQKTKKREIGFAIGIKAGGVFTSKITVPSVPGNNDSGRSIINFTNPDIKVRINAYTAMSYSFSYLKYIHKKHLENYGLKIEILTGLNAVKANFKSNEMQIKDTNNIQMIIKRKGYVVRSKSKLFAEELLPFYRNPGIALSFGLKWQLSDKNKLSFNFSNLGFIYFSRTKSYLHKGNDTINLKSENDPFASYADSLKSYSDDHNEAYYFLPFDINAFFEHRINKKHSLNLMANCNPILQNYQLSVFLNKTVLQFQLIPSIHLINFNKMTTGFGIAKNSKFISWGITINYLANTVNLYRNTFYQNYSFNDMNNFQSAFYIYYHLIKKTTRQNSRNHKLVKSYVRN